MSQFYDILSKYYDSVFPMQAVRIETFRKLCGPPSAKILDIACGDGAYAGAMSNLGYDVTAIDLNANMIERCKKSFPRVNALCLDMDHIDGIDQDFKLIYCIGNSLVHLESEEKIFKLLSNCQEKLQKDGALLLQIINYDRILDQNLPGLPTITNENIRFERFYDRCEDNYLNFRTVLHTADGIFENTEKLLCMRSRVLHDLCAQAGLTCESYGDFALSPFDIKNSVPFILICRRK